MGEQELETRSAVQAVEAALFSAGRPVDVASLSDTTGYDRDQVRSALQHLQEDYRSRGTALEVEPAGEKWTMQVRTTYAEDVRTLAPMEVPEKTLKTLALIAYHQPILQSDLQDMVGSKVYDHVRELKDLGLLRKRRHERSYLLSTTEKFPEYFGLSTTDPEEIRRQLAEKVGIPLPRDDGRGNRTLDNYEDADEVNADPDEGVDVDADPSEVVSIDAPRDPPEQPADPA